MSLSDAHLAKLIGVLFETAETANTYDARLSALECLTKLAVAAPNTTRPVAEPQFDGPDK